MEKYKILEIDPYLANFERDINLRMDRYNSLKKRLTEKESLIEFASAYEFYGIHKTEGGYVYREWAPNAKALFFLGDFNGWNNSATPMRSIGNGNWEVFVPFDLKNTYVKVRICADNYDMERIPLYIQYVARDENSYSMTARILESDYQFKNKNFKRSKNPPMIYECHIGMAQEKEGVGTYEEFRLNILPKIKELGFNTIQIMGIMEHPYYGSFGYQVSNFFAPCSLFGTPDDLKRLVDEAHGMGIAVLLDIVHSHAVKNTIEGINLFDGSEGQFFSGDHPAWGSKIFDYSKDGVLQFLLSNVKYYLDKFDFDGFRFDGVTSMLYTHNGLGTAFDCYDKYFSMSTNIDAINYLQLATEVARSVKPDCLMISEDMSGMPGMCLPIKDGGIGFDFRLMMGTPDMWIKLIDDTRDENWSMNGIYYELTSRRPMEKAIGYAESHDQALVGDKTVIFRLIDKEMYWHMSKNDVNLIVDRGIALYKLIYAITMTLGGNGYLNFMGNEFGHPEWIDFPREGNGYSYKYARRQWSLVENKDLKYGYLNEFNKDLINICKDNKVLEYYDKQIYIDEGMKIIAYRKGDLLFAMSFHDNYSPTDLFLQLNEKVDAKLIFTTDEPKYGGFNRVKVGEKHDNISRNGSDGILVYLPCRTFNIYKLQPTK
ncbi:MAG: alpha-amylase family glycosyl hydrolase [Clostridia bacterium]